MGFFFFLVFSGFLFDVFVVCREVGDVLCGTLPIFVGVVVVSALGTVLMFWSESDYAALTELGSPRRCVCRKWIPP